MRRVAAAGSSGRRAAVAVGVACLAVVGGSAQLASGAPAAATSAPRVTLSRSSGPPGAAVVASGRNFAGRASVSVRFDGVVRATGTTSASGGFRITIHVPRAAGGSHTVGAVDGRGRAAHAAFRVTQVVNLAPLTVSPDDQVCDRINVPVPDHLRVGAFGFGPAQALHLELGSVAMPSLHTDATGSASASLLVPRVTAGIRTLTVTDPGPGYVRRRVVAVQSFSCWSATSNSSGLHWIWDGVGWDAGVGVSLRLTLPGGGLRVVHRATSGPHGGFGVLAFTGGCPAVGSYPVTISGRSQGRTITIKAGSLHILGAC
jgi:hypothetical protein